MRRFESLSLLGEGACGRVFRALDVELKREVAIKVLKSALAVDPEDLARFDREVRLAARISHPCVVRVLDLVEEDGRPALVMELVRGVSLADLVAAGPLDPALAVDIARQAADGLAAMHEADLVHRDVKPANIMRADTGRVVVMDFSLARASDSTLLTAPGSIVGTPRFLPPEVFGVGTSGPGHDVYSLALTLHELITGRPARVAPSLEALVRLIASGPAPSLAGTAGIPPRLVELQARALARDPRERPTMRAYRDGLGRLASRPSAAVRAGVEPLSPSPSGAPPRETLHPAAGPLALLAMALLVLVAAAMPRRPPPAPVEEHVPDRADLDQDARAAATELMGVLDFACRTSDTSILIDFDCPSGDSVVVRVHREPDRRLLAVREKPAGPRWFHDWIPGLPPETHLSVDVLDAAGRTLVRRHPARTRGATHALTNAELESWQEAEPRLGHFTTDLIVESPDPRHHDLLKRLLSGGRKAVKSSLGQLARAVEATRDPVLGDLLAGALERVSPDWAAGPRALDYWRALSATRAPRSDELARRSLTGAASECAAAACAGILARRPRAGDFERVQEVAAKARDPDPFVLAMLAMDRVRARAAFAAGLRSPRPAPVAWRGMALSGHPDDAARVVARALEVREPDPAIAGALLAVGDAPAGQAAIALARLDAGAGDILDVAAIGAGDGARKLLEELLRARDPRVRAQAARAVGAGRMASLVPRLRELLADQSVEVVSAAAGTLGLLRDPGSKDALRAAARRTGVDTEALDRALESVSGTDGPAPSGDPAAAKPHESRFSFPFALSRVRAPWRLKSGDTVILRAVTSPAGAARLHARVRGVRVQLGPVPVALVAGAPGDVVLERMEESVTCGVDGPVPSRGFVHVYAMIPGR